MALELSTILEHFSKPLIPFSARFLFHIFSLLSSFQYLLAHLLWVDDLGPILLRKIEPIRREPLHTLRIIFNNLSISVLIIPLLPLVWKDHSHTYQRPIFLQVHLISALLLKNFTAVSLPSLFISIMVTSFQPTWATDFNTSCLILKNMLYPLDLLWITHLLCLWRNTQTSAKFIVLLYFSLFRII